MTAAAPPQGWARLDKQGRPFLIRPSVPGDIEALVELLDAVAAEEEWLLIQPGQSTAGDEIVLLRSLDEEGGLSLTVIADQAIVGRLMIQRISTTGGPVVGELAMIVAATHRDRGVGGALIEAAIEWCRQTGIHQLTLRVLGSNARAIALYRRHGFVDVPTPPTTAVSTVSDRRHLVAKSLLL